jgi:hypothetical protein
MHDIMKKEHNVKAAAKWLISLAEELITKK